MALLALAAVAVASLPAVPPREPIAAPGAAPPQGLMLVTQTAANTSQRLTPMPPRAFVKGGAAPGVATLTVDRSATAQTIVGFGGAFTGSSAWLYAQMNATMKAQFISMYFGRAQGIGYTLGRVPMGSADFAVQPSVSYAMVANDTDLELFSIDVERAWKLPLIADASAAVQAASASSGRVRGGASGQALGLVASPWSPPAWMKTNKQMICDLWSIVTGCQIEDSDAVKAVYANYFVKTAQAYRQAGAPIRWFTPQNEPGVKPFTYEGSEMNAEQQTDFIERHLGPALATLPAAERPGILVYDWNKNSDYVQFAGTVYNNSAASQYVEGSAVHWYDGDHFDSLSQVHALAPGKIILATEATARNDVDKAWEGGSWSIGEHYLHDLLGDLNNHVTGFIHWNLALKDDGGPLHVGPIVGLPIFGSDAPVIVDVPGSPPLQADVSAEQADAVLARAGQPPLPGRGRGRAPRSAGEQRIMAQVSYWYVGHVSRYALPGSVVLGTALSSVPDGVEATAVELPGGAGVVVVVLNTTPAPVVLDVVDAANGMHGNVTVPGNAAQTLRFA